MTWHRNLAVGALVSSCACGAPLETRSTTEGHGVLAGSLSITVVEEGSGARLQGARVRVFDAEGALIVEGTTGGDGSAELTHASLVGALAVDVSVGDAAQRIEGLRSAELVLAMPAEVPSTTRVTGTVTGLPASSEHTTHVGVGSLVTLMRTQSLDAVAPSPCIARAAGHCTFEAQVAREVISPSMATVSDTSGAIAFVFGQISESATRLDETLPPLELSLRLPSDDAGLVGVIGVPGLALEGQLVLLPQVQMSASALRVPSVTGNAVLSRASYWVLVEGHPTLGTEADPHARSVLFRRGVSASSTVAWDAWLDVPTIHVEGPTVSFDTIEGADVYAVDFIDGEGVLLGASWVLEGASRVDVTRPMGVEEGRVQRIRVRAIDTSAPPSITGLDATAIELGAQRFSERDWVR